MEIRAMSNEFSAADAARPEPSNRKDIAEKAFETACNEGMLLMFNGPKNPRTTIPQMKEKVVRLITKSCEEYGREMKILLDAGTDNANELEVCKTELQAKLADAERERDEWKQHKCQPKCKNCPAKQSLYGQMQQQRHQKRTLKAEAERLTGVLEKYGRHGVIGGPICESSKHSDYPCTCGFGAALAHLTEAVEQAEVEAKRAAVRDLLDVPPYERLAEPDRIAMWKQVNANGKKVIERALLDVQGMEADDAVT